MCVTVPPSAPSPPTSLSHVCERTNWRHGLSPARVPGADVVTSAVQCEYINHWAASTCSSWHVITITAAVSWFTVCLTGQTRYEVCACLCEQGR